MVNPHLLYCFGFLIALILYALGWSDAYLPLTISLTAFICITLILHFILSRRWSKSGAIQFYKTSPKTSPIFITLFLYSLWIADFIYEGGVPLIKVLLNQPYDYRTFGVPSLHVLAVTFSSFYILYLFHIFLSQRNKIILVLYIINSAAAILIYSRSMLYFNLAGSICLYLLSLKKIQIRALVALCIAGLALLYFFGVAGNKRVSFQQGTVYEKDIFLDIGKASKRFRDSGIPEEFFWSYIYISSPLANLQVNVERNKVPPITIKRIFEYINNEILFESISKRINTQFGIERETELVIKDPFNVSTVYSRSYSYLGWPGMIFMTLLVLILPGGYLMLLKDNNPYRLTGVAILCTVYLFMVYDNTIRLMALGFQLVYPVTFPIAEKLFNAAVKKLFNKTLPSEGSNMVAFKEAGNETRQ